MITDLQIENFRGIDRLHMPGLARVNLLVGHNAVGKTSVLEALALLNSASPTTAHQLDALRDFYPEFKATSTFGAFRHLFRDVSKPARLQATWPTGPEIATAELVPVADVWPDELDPEMASGQAQVHARALVNVERYELT